MSKSSIIHENNKAIQYLTEKIRSLEIIEDFYNKVQKLLGQSVDTTLPLDLDFNYYRELIKIRKQEIGNIRWMLQVQSMLEALKPRQQFRPTFNGSNSSHECYSSIR
jgi:hypothetical protein